jgi:hypothetical protein
MFNNVTPIGATRSADDISVTRPPLNYVVASADVEAHLVGIDNALAAASGGAVETIANVATGTLLGRVASGVGNSEELTPAQVRALIEVERGATAGADWNTNVANRPTLGTAAATDVADYATAAQGARADAAVQPGDLAAVATTGAYGDLAGTPALGSAAGLDVGTSAHHVVQLDAAGALPPVDGSNLLNLPAGSGSAAGTSYDNTTCGLVGTDVQAAIEELAGRTDSRFVAVIAGADAPLQLRNGTPYVVDGDAETIIAQAILDGARSLMLVGTCTAGATVRLNTADRVDLTGMPGASLAGDLDLDAVGSGPVRLDVAVTGVVSDSGGRSARPLYDDAIGVSVQAARPALDTAPASDPTGITGASGVTNVVFIGRIAYDALGAKDASTLYLIDEAS